MGMAVVMMMVIVAVMIMMIVVMIVTAVIEKLGFEFQNAIEIERTAPQHIR